MDDPGRRQAGEPTPEQPAWGTPPAWSGNSAPDSASPGNASPGNASPGNASPGNASPGTPAPDAGGEIPAPPPWGTPPGPEGPPAAGLPGQFGPPVPPPIPHQRRSERRSGWGKAVGAGVGAAALAGKAGLLGKALLLLKGFAVLAKFKVLVSMLLSVGVYALFWGWKFALGFVILLAIHEFGHVLAFRAQGVEVSAPMFIPMFGAFVTMKEQPRSVAHEAWSALAGPAAGLFASIVCLELAQLGDSLLLRALAYTSFLLNLFNLLPMLPLDGGRVAGALHPVVWLAGIGISVLILIWRPSPVLGFVLVFGGIEAIRRWREHRSGRAGDYHKVPASARGWIAAAYVTTAVLCLWGMNASYVPRPY